MLYLNPPFHIIEGVSLFSDHADPLQYYYLPLAPKLTERKDKTTGERIPQIQLIKYRGEAGSGGFLSFDVNIGVEEDVLEDIRNELRRLERLDETPRLAPVPLVDGTVKVMLLGKQTGDTPEEGDRFVIKIHQNAKPSLYGNNQAAFSVELDKDGVMVMEKALQGEMAPIGIVYSLDFFALRPAYSVRIKADWDRVQKHLEEKFAVDAIFVSIEIDKVVDELIENRAIIIEVDTFVPEGEDTSGIIGRRDQAVNDVRDMVINSFFEPSLKPIEGDKEDGWDKFQNLAERATAIGVTGGIAACGSFTYKNIDYTRIDKKSLNVNMSERTTVKRSIYPQGHLGGIFRVLRRQGMDLDRFVISVDLDDDWFKRRRVNVISRANFEEDLISSLNVNLGYGSESDNVILEASNPRASVDWPSIIQEGTMKREVTTDYKVSFKGVDGTERPIALQSPVKVVTVENLEITPRELYSITPLPIIALNFPWEKYPHIEVQTRYTDEENRIRLEESFLLDKDNTEKTWKIFVRDPEKSMFQYKLVYRAADHKDIEMSWVETDEGQLIIRDPYPRKRTLTVVPALRWAEVDRAFVDVTYDDEENDIFKTESFEFTQADATTKTFSVGLKNPDHRRVAFQATILFKDGRVTEIPSSFTHDRRIIVRSNMKGHKIIPVRPEEGDFAERNLEKITVQLRYEDSENGLDFNDTFEFKSSGDRQAFFEFDYMDEQKKDYGYCVSYLFSNGLTRTDDWKTSSAETLELSLP